MTFFTSLFSPKARTQPQTDTAYEAEVASENKTNAGLESDMHQSETYLDYASLTPVDERVLQEFVSVTREFQANPSSLYAPGVRASKKMDESRERIAKCLEVHADEVYFTSGGTESNNLAIRGLFGSIISQVDFRPHIISTVVEHPSVLEVLKDMKRSGICDVTLVPVSEEGLVDLKEFKAALRTETVLVTVQYVNNEIGTIQPIAEIAKAIRHFRKNSSSVHPALPYFHTDACQAPAYCSMRVPSLGVDMVTLDGGKIYGPRGFGILYAKRSIQLKPLMFGGAQEASVRPGTEHVANASAFALALELCGQEREAESARIKELRDGLLTYIQGQVANLQVNGSLEERLPNNINVCLPGMDAEFAVIRLDAKGVHVSSVTSCRSKKEDSSSYVVEALGKPDCAKSSLRITLGRMTTTEELERAKASISGVLTSML